MKIKPIHFNKRYKLDDNSYSSIGDIELLDYIYQELKKKDYQEIKLKGDKIVLKGDFYSFFIWSFTHGLDYGKITIEKKSNLRKVRFEYQVYRVLLVGIVLSLLLGIISQSLLLGLIVFIIAGIFSWLVAIGWQITNVGTILEKLRIQQMKK